MSSGPTGPVDDGAVAASGATAPCAEPDQQEQEGEARYATATAGSNPRGEEQQRPAAGTEADASPVAARGTDEPAAADEKEDGVLVAGSVSDDDDDDNDDERSSGASSPGTVAIISYVAVVESSAHTLARDAGKLLCDAQLCAKYPDLFSLAVCGLVSMLGNDSCERGVSKQNQLKGPWSTKMGECND